MTLTRTFAAGALLLAACGGEASLGDDAGENWGVPSEETASDESAETLYRGERKVHTFTVADGTLYAILGTRIGVPTITELVACAVDDCAKERWTLWRSSAESASFGSLVVAASKIFWVDNYQHRVMSCALDGCEKTSRSIGVANWNTELTADADSVYWLDEGKRLVRCPHAGCESGSPELDPHLIGISLAQTGDQLVSFGDSVYARFEGGRRLVRWEKGGVDEPEVLYDSVLPLSLFDIDGAGIHFATAILAGEIKRCPLSGACGSGEVLAVAQRWPTVVKVAPAGLLWVSSVPDDAAFVKLAPGGTPRALAPQTGTLGPVVVDGGYVYWAESPQYSDIDQIRRVAL